MSKVCIVRALWGSRAIVTTGKAHHDAENSKRYAERLAGSGLNTAAISFGREHVDRLAAYGYPAIVLPDEPPAIYGATPRSIIHSDPHGRWVDGLSMWWHKLAAIEYVLRFADAILWLDWDTVFQQDIPADLFERLAKGPAVQGRMRKYARTQCPWRPGNHSRYVMHGGCYYIRGHETILRLIEISATQFPIRTDEVSVTRYVDDATGGDVDKIYPMGFDNPYLYCTNTNVCPDLDVPALFREGWNVKLKKSQAMQAKHYGEGVAIG